MDEAKGHEVRQARRVVVIESPFRNRDGTDNQSYSKECLRHSLVTMNEIPLASHLLYTQILDDGNEAEREHGMKAGWAMYSRVDAVIFYVDNGLSEGMALGLHRAIKLQKKIEFRYIKTFDVISSGVLPALEQTYKPHLVGLQGDRG